ncbi:MAG: hypothetical protein GEU73_01435 [Chloroflexi bacterium]|nr:hypothetical protein [Chloroflexota bacterium]
MADVEILDHCGFSVPDVREGVEFWEKVFGAHVGHWNSLTTDDLGGPHTGVNLGDFFFVLFAHTDRVPNPERPRGLDRDVRSVTLDPTDDRVVYAGTEPVRLFRSEDAGDTWDELDAIQTLPLAVRKEWWFPLSPHEGHALSIYVHPENPRIIYVGLEHGGIIRSRDRGETWEDVSGGIDYLDIHHIESIPGDADRYYVSSARGFYTSQDPADGWVRAENGCTRDYFHDFLFLPPRPSEPSPTLLCATADKSPGSWEEPGHAEGAVFRSRDGARSWERVGEGLPDLIEEAIWGFVKHPLDDDGAFFGLGKMYLRPGFENGPGSALMTRNRGDSWTRLELDLPAVRALWAAPD